MHCECPLNFVKTHPDAKKPSRATTHSSGLDLYCIDDIKLWPGDTVNAPIGLILEIPKGFEGQIRSRSGLAAKSSIAVLNSPGTIDSDYRGEIIVILHNHGCLVVDIKAGDRVAQLVIAPTVTIEIKEVKMENLSNTDRGDRGLGSTGD